MSPQGQNAVLSSISKQLTVLYLHEADRPGEEACWLVALKHLTTFLILFIFLHRNLGNTDIRVFIIKTSIEQQSLPI